MILNMLNAFSNLKISTFNEFTGTNPMISQEVSLQPQNFSENTRYRVVLTVSL